MKVSAGRSVVRLGDTASHGGKVLSASSSFKALGILVALEGDLVSCPRRKGQFEILPAYSERKHHGMAVAYKGMATT